MCCRCYIVVHLNKLSGFRKLRQAGMQFKIYARFSITPQRWHQKYLLIALIHYVLPCFASLHPLRSCKELSHGRGGIDIWIGQRDAGIERCMKSNYVKKGSLLLNGVASGSISGHWNCRAEQPRRRSNFICGFVTTWCKLRYRSPGNWIWRKRVGNWMRGNVLRMCSETFQ